MDVQVGYADALVTSQGRTDSVSWPVPADRYIGRVFVPSQPVWEALGVVTQYQGLGRVCCSGDACCCGWNG